MAPRRALQCYSHDTRVKGAEHGLAPLLARPWEPPAALCTSLFTRFAMLGGEGRRSANDPVACCRPGKEFARIMTKQRNSTGRRGVVTRFCQNVLALGATRPSHRDQLGCSDAACGSGAGRGASALRVLWAWCLPAVSTWYTLRWSHPLQTSTNLLSQPASQAATARRPRPAPSAASVEWPRFMAISRPFPFTLRGGVHRTAPRHGPAALGRRHGDARPSEASVRGLGRSGYAVIDSLIQLIGSQPVKTSVNPIRNLLLQKLFTKKEKGLKFCGILF